MSMIFLACDRGNVLFEENQNFEDNTWSFDDPKTFSYHSKDSITPVKLYINLRTTTDFPYRNIYMFLHSNYSNGYSNIDTLQFFLADAEGNWLGDNSGTIVENRALVSKGVFRDTGTYSFTLEQAMRNDSLTEILDVGVRIERLGID